jgi:hypothetical protein
MRAAIPAGRLGGIVRGGGERLDDHRAGAGEG